MPVLDTSRDDAPDLARQLTWRVRRVALAANALGALVVFFALALVGSAPGDLGSERSTELVVLFGAYLMLSAVPISVFLGRAARPFVHAIASGGPITGAARRELLRSPWLNAELDAGIGVSSGRVVAGNVGTEERYEYTVIGDPVNEAARLSDEAKTRPGRVLAAERTVEALGGDGEAEGWREAAVFELRGRPEPTRAFEVR